MEGTPLIVIIFPKPSLARFGSFNPLTAIAVLARVLLPSSPYLYESGSSPIPTPSSIMIKKLFS